MADLARKAASDPTFAEFARSLGGLTSADLWIRAHYAYRDEDEEIVRSPQFMLADMGRSDNGRIVALEGDCDDVSTFYAAICKALGLSASFVAIRYHTDNPNFEHVFVEAYDSGQWRTLDATVAPGTPIHSLETVKMPV